MPKPPRAPTPREIELSVLDQSRRRCALCYHLKGDLGEKHGQIAHLDDNRANYAEDNLAFLCMEHHSVYDSKTSQHKNYTIQETKAARKRLYEAVRQDRHVNGNPPLPAGRETDRVRLERLIENLRETIFFLRGMAFGSYSFSPYQFSGLDFLSNVSDEVEYEFIDVEIEKRRRELIEAGLALLWALPSRTYQLPYNNHHGVPQGWRDSQPERFREATTVLDAAAARVCRAYDELVRYGRVRLAP